MTSLGKQQPVFRLRRLSSYREMVYGKPEKEGDTKDVTGTRGQQGKPNCKQRRQKGRQTTWKQNQHPEKAKDT
jgi:hypothetical protein